jgi:hypothetical protein
MSRDEDRKGAAAPEKSGSGAMTADAFDTWLRKIEMARAVSASTPVSPPTAGGTHISLLSAPTFKEASAEAVAGETPVARAPARTSQSYLSGTFQPDDRVSLFRASGSNEVLLSINLNPASTFTSVNWTEIMAVCSWRFKDAECLVVSHANVAGELALKAAGVNLSDAQRGLPIIRPQQVREAGVAQAAVVAAK